MVWQALLFLGLGALQAQQSIKAAQGQAKAITRQANLDAANKAKELRRRTALVQSSFLSSGFELEGTPITSLTGIFDEGIADIQQIGANANMRAKNLVRNARNEAIGNLMTTAAMSGFGASGFGGPTGLFMEGQAPSPISYGDPFTGKIG